MVSDINSFVKNGQKLRHRMNFTDFFFFICSLRLNIVLPLLPEVYCPNVLDIRNFLGGKWKEAVSDLNTFAHKGCKIATLKQNRFLANFALLAGFLYRGYYPHRSRDALSHVCGIFHLCFTILP